MAPLHRELVQALPRVAYWGALSTGSKSDASARRPHTWEESELAFVATHLRRLFVQIKTIPVSEARSFIELDEGQLAALAAHLGGVRPLSDQQRAQRQEKLSAAAAFFKSQ